MGYFLFMLLFMLVAHIRAKKGNPWIWYFIGATIQLVSLIGLSRNPFYSTGKLWIIYIVILIMVAVSIGNIVSKREQQSKAHPYGNGNDSIIPMKNYGNDEIQNTLENRSWKCMRCGNSNPEHFYIYGCGMKKAKMIMPPTRLNIHQSVVDYYVMGE